MNTDMLEHLLGEGAHSWVYSIKNDRNLVAKISKSGSEHLKKEAKILAMLGNKSQFPKIVNSECLLRQYGNGPDSNFLLMERLGISLEELMRLRGGRLGVSTIKNIGLQLLRKIVLLHSTGVVHNDIKPANILFGTKQKRTQVFLVDFGLATFLENNRNTGMFVGNTLFAGVGKLRGEHTNELQDIQSLMYVLLWLLVGGEAVWKQSNINQRTTDCNCHECLDCLNQRINEELRNKLLYLSDRTSLSQSCAPIFEVTILTQMLRQMTFGSHKPSLCDKITQLQSLLS